MAYSVTDTQLLETTFNINAVSNGYVIQAVRNKQWIMAGSGDSMPDGIAFHDRDHLFAWALLQPTASIYRFLPTSATPLGIYKIQDVVSSHYVVARPELVADSSLASATSFLLVPMPGSSGSSLQNTADNYFVFAEPSGTQALSADKVASLTGEVFVITPKAGTTDQHTILASINGKYIVSRGAYGLFHTAETITAAGAFRLTPV